MKHTFIEAKTALYAYIDRHLDQKPYADNLRGSARATVRRWLGEQHAPINEITALAQDMGLTNDQQQELTCQVLSQIGRLNSESDEVPTHCDGSCIPQAFTLADHVRGCPRLSHDEEAVAIKAFQAGESAKARLDAEGSSLSSSERRELEFLVSLGTDAQERLLMGNWGLVMHYVKMFCNMGVSEDDLIQESALGLIRAMKSYIPGKAAFSTYAVFWIKKFCHEAIANQGRSIPLSPNLTYVLGKINKAAAEFEAKTGEVPTVEDISEVTDLSTRKVTNALRNEKQSHSCSFDELCRSDAGTRTLAETIPDPNAEKQFDRVLGQAQRCDIIEVLHRVLTPREEKVILLRFGFNNKPPKTLSELGGILNRTKECARLIEKTALNKLRADEDLKQYFLSNLA